jgi:hypothetical protein
VALEARLREPLDIEYLPWPESPDGSRAHLVMGSSCYQAPQVLSRSLPRARGPSLESCCEAELGPSERLRPAQGGAVGAWESQ